jgi:hypothetical protein
MSKADNPRRIVNAGALIGKALAPKQLKLLLDLVQRAQATSSGHDAGTLRITLGKLRQAVTWKALNTKSRAG